MVGTHGTEFISSQQKQKCACWLSLPKAAKALVISLSRLLSDINIDAAVWCVGEMGVELLNLFGANLAMPAIEPDAFHSGIRR